MRNRKLKIILTYTVMIVVILLIAVPFLYMLTSSFKTDIEISRNAISLIPHQPTLDNFKFLFERIPFWKEFGNSSFVSIVSSLFAMLICSIVSYGFVRFEFKGKNVLFTLVLVTMMIPNQVFLIPQFRMYQFLGAYNTYFPLILPYISTAFGIFLVKQVMEGVPRELFESATIDGCSELGIYARIAMPLSVTGVGILGVLTFMNAWNDFMTPLIYLSEEPLFTLTIGLSKLVGFYTITYAVPMSGALLSSIPVILILTLVGQKYFVNGLIVGAVKG